MILFDSKHGEVAWDEELKAVIIEWKGFAYGEEFQLIMLKGIEWIKKMKSNRLLMDARKGSAIKPDDQEWIARHFVQRAYGNGLRHFAMVLPQSMIAKLSLDRAVNQLGVLPYQLVNFSDMKEARHWVAETPAVAKAN
ncbi:hypothetical protein FHS16_001783 [Paenibacillus endophyticus]|uniref:STAS/SEC14 domain-containing protein n=1 Tax=Paenibacillus endophyticus TaxID=1294268 RepID=A0A7W5GA99_9BACL|nr:hypothetical protein [Paenibacillus endophyticus]MBB3151737.1 hypothetical protein [Paenibacillus endophyticus]